MPNHDTFLWKTACVSASARVPNSFVRDFKRQAAELRRTGREVARGLKRKNRWDFPRETSPLVSVALLSLFPLSTPKKLLAFEHGRDRYKLRRAALDCHSRDIYLWVQSLNPPPSAPYASSWGEFSNVHLANTWLRQITGGNHFLRVRPHMASAVTLKDEIQHGATHADMVAAVFGCSNITVSFKEIASRFCQCWLGKYCRYTGKYFE